MDAASGRDCVLDDGSRGGYIVSRDAANAQSGGAGHMEHGHYTCKVQLPTMCSSVESNSTVNHVIDKLPLRRHKAKGQAAGGTPHQPASACRAPPIGPKLQHPTGEARCSQATWCAEMLHRHAARHRRARTCSTASVNDWPRA